MIYINIFGSTGSIGKQTLEIVEKFPDNFQVNILCGGSNISLLSKQATHFKPRAIIVKNELLQKLKLLLPEHKNIYSIEQLGDVLEKYPNFEKSVMAINGFQALEYSMVLIKYSKDKSICMANKESIVCGGDLFLNEIQKQNITLIPIDSEHNSIFQLLNNIENPIQIHEVKKLIITASGGPFLSYSKSQLEKVKAENAIKNPNWTMGAKISIDSANLMNKALELIEGHYLFKLPIDAVIHPQSIVHAFVHKKSGEEISFLSNPDMKVHIAHSLFYPETPKYFGSPVQKHILSFQKISKKRFPIFGIARQILKEQKIHLSILLNVAGEFFVEKFLKDQILFLQIEEFVEKCFDKYSNYQPPESLNQVIQIDQDLRSRISEKFNN